MSVKKRIIILVVSLLGITGIIIGVSYAFFSIGGIQETANTFTSGCLNISLTNESTSIHLTNAYPITDIEGLETTSYDFTVKNNCNSSANYQINLESLNEQVNSLNADYIKVSLSSDTVGNVISKLSDNKPVTPTIDNAYESYNLYTDSLNANEEKTYHLKIWVDYDATVEEAANKVYQSKINVIANPETTIVDTLEAKFNLEDKTMTSTLTDNVTSASYCITTNNICEPNTSATISNNTYSVELEGNENKQIVCTKLNGTSKVICSDPMEIAKTLLADAILAQEGGAQTIESKGTPDFSQTATTDEGIYAALDEDNKTSYYYRGAVDDNWVSFAGFYWRIIRINGDGSVRLIYAGVSDSATPDSSNTRGSGTQIGTSTYSINSSTYNDNAYVGYMYTLNQAHGTGTESGIKKVVDSWYKTNIVDEGYSSHVDTNAGFCNDRTIDPTSSGTGIGTSATYYGAYNRLYDNKSPSFKCSDKNNDLFTESSSNKGNKKLTYPVGLITADEVSYAGGVARSSNNSYYLYTGMNYWTMSPFNFSSSRARVFYVYWSGDLDNWFVEETRGVRPVINLKADVTITGGNGSSSTPFEVTA